MVKRFKVSIYFSFNVTIYCYFNDEINSYYLNNHLNK